MNHATELIQKEAQSKVIGSRLNSKMLMYMKRNYVYEKRRMKETYVFEKRPMNHAPTVEEVRN